MRTSCGPARPRPPRDERLSGVALDPEFNLYAIERVYEHGRLVGLRLIEPEDADTAQCSGPCQEPQSSVD